MFFLVVILLLACVAVPLAYAWRVWRLNEPSLAAWLVVVADAVVFVALILLVGRWDMAGYYTRYLLLAFFVAAVMGSLGKHASGSWRATDGAPVLRRHWTSIISLVLFGGALVYVVYGILPPAEPRELAFPLKTAASWSIREAASDSSHATTSEVDRSRTAMVSSLDSCLSTARSMLFHEDCFKASM